MNSCSRNTGKSAFGQAVRQLLFKALTKYRRFGLEDGVRVRLWHFVCDGDIKARVNVFGFVVWLPLALWAKRVFRPPKLLKTARLVSRHPL